MPEPAAVAVEPTVLTFKTLQEKIEAQERMQNERELGPDDLAEIEKINAAKVLEPEPVEDEGVPAAPAPAQTEVKPVVKPEATPTGEPKGEGGETTHDRSWQITEDLLKKYDEEYTDRTGRRRPTFLAKDPEGFVKMAADSQRYIRYLENTKMTQVENAGYERAKSEHQADMDRMRKELEEAKKVKQTPAPQVAPAAAAAGQPVQAMQETDPQAMLDSLKGVSDDDMVDKVPSVVKALTAAVAKISQLESNMKRMDSEGPTALKTQNQRQQEEQRVADENRKAQQDRDEASRTAENAKKAWRDGCRMIDSFASTPDCPPDLRMDQGMEGATAEAMQFHNDLAILYSGKPLNQITQTDVANAATAYLAGLPELTQKARNAGIPEPANYRKWVIHDQLDALRTGLFRDPVTKQWQQRFDQSSGRPVTFPDVASAYREFLAITGQDKAKVAQAVKSQTQQIVAAIQTRDKGMSSMDSSRTMQEGQGGLMGEQQANERLVQLEQLGGVEEAQRRARQGDKEMLDQYNQCLGALGSGSISVSP